MSLLPATQRYKDPTLIPLDPHLSDRWFSVCLAQQQPQLESQLSAHAPSDAPPYPTATHIPLSRLVLAATGNCDSGVWLARGLPPPRPGGQAGASLGGRQGPSHLMSKGLGPGVSSPQQGRHSTWVLIGGSSRRTQGSSTNHTNFPTVCDGYSHFPGEETEVRRVCCTCPGHTAGLGPWGHSGGARWQVPAAGVVEPSLRQRGQSTCFPRHPLVGGPLGCCPGLGAQLP